MAGVMVVEDDPALRGLLREALEKRKYVVITASDGREALAKFRPSVIDLVITDLLMPEEDGLMVIMKIREIKPSTKMIAISGGERQAREATFSWPASLEQTLYFQNRSFLPNWCRR